MAAQQKRFALNSAVVIISSMKMEMAKSTVEAAEAAMRCVPLPFPYLFPAPPPPFVFTPTPSLSTFPALVWMKRRLPRPSARP